MDGALCSRLYIDAATFAVEHHFTIDEREQRVVFALANASARVNTCYQLGE